MGMFSSRSNTKLFGIHVVVIIPLLFMLIAIVRLLPFENQLNAILNGADDWTRYARLALEIKHHGLLISNLHELYFSPNGFLYNYFVAGCFSLFGENTIPLFLVQNLMLGLSVALVYLTYKNKMNGGITYLFLLTLIGFALLDISKYYTFRLLSENLALMLLAIFFYIHIKGLTEHKIRFQFYAIILLGLACLTRPNILPFGFLFVVFMSRYFWQKNKFKYYLLFCILFLLSCSFLGIRNYLVCGSWTFLPTEGFSFFEKLFNNPDLTINIMLRKLAFFGGIISAMEPGDWWRAHWTLIWVGFFIYLFRKGKSKIQFEHWEYSTLLFIICYYGVLLLIAEVQSYGFRYIVPVILFVIPFCFIALDKLKSKKEITTLNKN